MVSNAAKIIMRSKIIDSLIVPEVREAMSKPLDDVKVAASDEMMDYYLDVSMISLLLICKCELLIPIMES